MPEMLGPIQPKGDKEEIETYGRFRMPSGPKRRWRNGAVIGLFVGWLLAYLGCKVFIAVHRKEIDASVFAWLGLRSEVSQIAFRIVFLAGVLVLWAAGRRLLRRNNKDRVSDRR